MANITHLHENAQVWNSDLKCFVSTKHEQLAGILTDYNPYFSLVFIPEHDRDSTDSKPFAILDKSPGKPPHIIRYLTSHEVDNTQEVLSWIFEGDLTKHKPSDIFTRMESRERAAELIKTKASIEESEDKQEFMRYAFAASSPNYLRHNGRTFDLG
jgi:hypothetical protein